MLQRASTSLIVDAAARWLRREASFGAPRRTAHYVVDR